MNNNFYNMLIGPIYYDTTDLRYNNQYKFFLSNQQLIEYKEFKNELIDNNNKFLVPVELKSFNSKYIFFTIGEALRALQISYLDIVINDLKENQMTIVEKNRADILMARVYSELEGSMKIEDVPTTRTKLEQLKKGKAPENQNDIIARNMLDGLDFIIKRPAFNKENLHQLYEILSKDCLKENQQLHNKYYRDDAVYIDTNYEGCPCDKIDEYMDSLFEFANKHLNEKKSNCKDFLPHICHYYILYIHPYFDYNGRTARMVSLWISILNHKLDFDPLFISEAINDNKKKYYDALRETRNMNNDLTYFLIYILNTAIGYSLLYRNLNFATDELLKKGFSLTPMEKYYLKEILLHAGEGYFDYKKFLSMSNVVITKQAALKALNKLVDYGVLSSMINDKKVKLFKLNDEWVKYSTKAFNK